MKKILRLVLLAILLFALLCIVGVFASMFATFMLKKAWDANVNNEIMTLLGIFYFVIILLTMLAITLPMMLKIKVKEFKFLAIGMIPLALILSGSFCWMLANAWRIQQGLGVDGRLMLGIILCPPFAISFAGLWLLLKLSE